MKTFFPMFLGLALLGSKPVAYAEPSTLHSRSALVIGVADYQSTVPLKNTLNDARLMAETLKGIGFELYGGSPVLDPDSTTLKKTVLSFLASLSKSSEAVIYFAGHGVQAGGDNMLLARDFKLPTDASRDQALVQAKEQSVVLSDVLSSIDTSQASLALIFLDCCRDHAFLSQAPGVLQTSGLAAPSISASGTNVLVGFSAKHGQQAMDGAGQNSPYTETLASLLKVPGLSINTTLQRLSASVKRSTENRQQPYFYGSLQNEVYLAGEPVDARQLGAAPPPGAASPETISGMMAHVAIGQEAEIFRRMLGSPSRTRSPDKNATDPMLYDSWSTKQFGLQTWYRPKEGKWTLVAYALHMHEARAIPIYHGTQENLLFVLGKTSTNQFSKTHSLDAPANKFEVDLGRWSGVAHQYYLGRLGQYWTYLIPAVNTANGMANADSPIVSFGVVNDDSDHALLELISYNVIAPMYMSEEEM